MALRLELSCSKEEILRLWSEVGKTFILITHHLDEAIFMSRRVIKGR